jgi:hypothetical protein
MHNPRVLHHPALHGLNGHHQVVDAAHKPVTSHLRLVARIAKGYRGSLQIISSCGGANLRSAGRRCGCSDAAMYK